MFCDEEPEPLPWDYFLTDYERDLLTLTFEEMVRKSPDKTQDEIVIDLKRIRANQSAFEEKQSL